MNNAIQPRYKEIKVTCSCGNSFNTRSTKCENLQLEVCSSCHPFYTGTQRVLDTAGRVDSFKKRFGMMDTRKV